MSTERAKEATEMIAKTDEEQSTGEQPKEIAKLEELKIEQEEEETEGIYVPNWLIEVLDWIKRMEMKESKMSTSCRAFKQLCWPKLHGNVKPHIVKPHYIEKAWFGNIIVSRHGHELPIPKVPPPEYILGFNELVICFLDDQVMEFIKLILPKLNDIVLGICTAMEWSPEDERTKAIGRLLNIFGDIIDGISFFREGRIQNFNRLFPGIIDQKQIKELYISPDKLTCDRDFDIPFDWLMNGRQPTDGQKLLKIGYIQQDYTGLERIKEAFLKDTDRRNFLVYYQFGRRRPIVQFRLENEKTGEILELYFHQNEELNEFGPCHLLIRCPKDEEDRWKKKGEKQLKVSFDWGPTRTSTSVMIETNIKAERKWNCSLM